MDMQTMKTRVSALVKDEGMTKLAVRTGLTRQTIYNVLNEDRWPAMSTLDKLGLLDEPTPERTYAPLED